MDTLKQIFKLSKQISKSLLRNKQNDDLVNTPLFNKKDKEYIIHQINNKESIEKRNKFIAKINKKQSWRAIQKQTTTTKTNYYKYAAAASIAIIIGSAFFIMYNTEYNKPQQHIIKTQTNVSPTVNKATLTLEDGKNVYLKQTEPYKNTHATKQGENLIYKSPKKEVVKIAYNYLTIPRGEHFFVQLEDGTKVWLNAESKLKFPVQFPKNQIREVELLYGEAYFDVAHSSNHNGMPFNVITNNQTIKVTGTQFNVKSYKYNQHIYTTLVKGKVHINTGFLEKNLAVGHQSIVKKGNKKIEIKEVDVFNEISWYKGIFIFEKKSLKEITDSLSRLYNVNFEFKNLKKETFIFSGLLKRGEKIDGILKNIEKTGEVSFERNNNHIVVK